MVNFSILGQWLITNDRIESVISPQMSSRQFLKKLEEFEASEGMKEEIERHRKAIKD